MTDQSFLAETPVAVDLDDFLERASRFVLERDLRFLLVLGRLDVSFFLGQQLDQQIVSWLLLIQHLIRLLVLAFAY